MKSCEDCGPSQEVVRVKDEPEHPPSPGDCYLATPIKDERDNAWYSECLDETEHVKQEALRVESVQRVPLAGLYTGHTVKDELVLGPEVLHRPNVTPVCCGGRCGSRSVDGPELYRRSRRGDKGGGRCGSRSVDGPELYRRSRRGDKGGGRCGSRSVDGPELYRRSRRGDKGEETLVKQEPTTVDEPGLLVAERSVESEAKEDAASAEEGPALASPVCGSAQSSVFSLPDVSASARARRQLAAACAVRLERLRESRAPCAQQHTYCCDMCTTQFKTKSTLIRHIRTHYRCADCRKSFMMSSCLSRHEPNCTENERKKRELTETSALTRSHGEVLYSCGECGKGFRIKSYLRKHIQKRHTVKHLLNSTKEKRFKCSHCDYKCHKKCNLQTHQRIHTGEKPFKCNHCDYKYGHKSSLRYHQSKHAGVNPFKCNYCDYKCLLKSQLQTHQRIHAEEKPFKCSYCDYKCHHKSQLQTHQRIHTGEKPFKCSYCDHKCHHKSQLQTHQRIHTGERPFKCNYCDYKFRQKCHLKTHQRIHTGEKPFKCNYCDYKCLLKSGLQTHQRIHTGEKPFKCGYCDYKCSDKSSLRRHHQRKHFR